MDNKGQMHHFSSARYYGNKENINSVSETNLHMPVITEEPQKTRKRKKGGGCSLRKSLAWNSAFFTEEGVLDPLELSIFSGSVSECSKSFLSRVNERGTSPVASFCINSDRSEFQPLEENQFRKFPARRQNEVRTLGGHSQKLVSPVREDPSLLSATRKVQVAKGTTRYATQGGDSQQAPSLYSETSITNTRINGMSKLLKPPATKTGSSIPPSIPKNIVQPSKRSKCSQNAPPVILEKNAGIKGFSINTGKGPSCTISTARSSSHGPGKSKASLYSEARLSVNLQSQVTKTMSDSDLKVIPDVALQADVHAPNGHVGPNKVTVTLPQHAQIINRNNPSTQYHMKPSGLRMPSPSLGYFSQGKVSASHSILSKKSQVGIFSESSNPSLRTPIYSDQISERRRLSMPSGRPPKKGFDAPVISTAGTVTSGMKVPSTLKSQIPSILALKSDLELKTQGNSSDSQSQEKSQSDLPELIDSGTKQIGKQTLIITEPHETEKVSNKNRKLLIIDLPVEVTKFGQSQKNQSIEHATDTNPVTRDRSGTEMENAQSLAKPRCKKQLIQNVSQHNKEVECLHVQDTESKTLPVGECHRPPNGNQSINIHRIMFDSQSEMTIVNTAQGSPFELESSQQLSKEQVACTETTKNLEETGSCLTKKIGSSGHAMSESSTSVCSFDDNGFMSGLSSDNSQISLSGNCEHKDISLQSQLKKQVVSTKDKTSMLQGKKAISDDDSKHDHVSTKYPVNAVPFSDEWVAALEAVGEDILTMKRGSVQNSPPDKSLPEPGPWSPVKRSKEGIGPFDCTKYTNLPPPDARRLSQTSKGNLIN